MTIYFSSDFHIGHKNILTSCDRPFNNIEEMNEAIIDNFNSKVKKQDTTYLLGDIVWKGEEEYYLKRLNGQKIIILGNHDNIKKYKNLLSLGVIQGVYRQKGITINNKYIWLSHYPHRSWNKSFHDSWHFYGHTHDTIPDYGLSCDIGVDKWNFFPVSFEEIGYYFKDIKNGFNLPIRDDYRSYDKDFHKYFTDKYLERINKESNILNSLL